MSSRRQFIRCLSFSGAALLGGQEVLAQTPAMVDPKEATAAALGYVDDATKADKVKFPKYAAGQNCAGCQLYQGKPGAATGPCPLYAGKAVTAKGWCSAFAKKA